MRLLVRRSRRGNGCPQSPKFVIKENGRQLVEELFRQPPDEGELTHGAARA
jgi:hypothetical protein